MLGGSPMMVAAPPMFEQSTVQMTTLAGGSCSILQSETVTGVTRRIVVTLSRKAETSAVARQSAVTRVGGEAPNLEKRRAADHSKTPVRER